MQARIDCDTAWTPAAERSHHSRMRVLAHIRKLDDCFGDFLVRVTCKCGAVREIMPEALARLLGWSLTLEELAQRMRCSQCGKKAAEVVAVAKHRPRAFQRIRTSSLSARCIAQEYACPSSHKTKPG